MLQNAIRLTSQKGNYHSPPTKQLDLGSLLASVVAAGDIAVAHPKGLPGPQPTRDGLSLVSGGYRASS